MRGFPHPLSVSGAAFSASVGKSLRLFGVLPSFKEKNEGNPIIQRIYFSELHEPATGPTTRT